MWPFDRKPTELLPEALPPGRDLADIAKRLDEFARRADKLEATVKQVDTEWSEWFDKFRRLYARIAKRQERDEESEAADKTPRQDDPGRAIDIQPVSGGPVPRARRNY